MDRTLRISRSLAARLVASAAESRVEVCGLLFGADGRVDAARPCANVHPTPHTHFEIDPAALIAAYRAERGGGPRLLGCYHSHPSGDAAPSPRDAEAAAPDGRVWLIVAGAQMTAWAAVRDGAVHGRFDPLTLSVTTSCARLAASPQDATVAAPADAATFRNPKPMPTSPVDFASLLCSRLCHDLLSPVGALNNGLELLADETDPAMRARCMDLLAESARVSANKLKFFRLAFGSASGFGEAIDTREAKGAIEGLYGENKRLTIGWLVEEEKLPKTAVKVLCNMAMIAGDALVRGGQLDIGAEQEGGTVEIVLRASGPRTVLDEEMRSTLVHGSAGGTVSPRAAAAYLVHALVAEAGGQVMVSDADDGGLLFGATLRAG